MFDKLANVVGKAVDKIPTEEGKINLANQAVANSQALDIVHAQARNNINLKNPRSWIEVVAVVGFTYDVLIVPILNDLLTLQLKGLNGGMTELLYALMGLGGYRMFEKVVQKK